MENKNKIIIAVVVVVIVAAVGYWIATTRKTTPAGENPNAGTPAGAETPQGTAAAPGASAVTEAGKVVTPSGQVADNSAEPGTAAAPQQSAPITKTEAPAASIKVDMGNSTFSPKEFTAKAGAATTLVVTSIDTQTHVFKFRDPSLQAVAVGIAPGETRLITFNAPTKAGDYEFFCDVPGHVARGEVGKMIVK